MSLISKICRFLRSEDGPTSVEYAVILMLIFAAVLGVVQVLGLTVGDSLGDSSNKIEQAVGGGN